MKEVFVITITFRTGTEGSTTAYYHSKWQTTAHRLNSDRFDSYGLALEKIKELMEVGDSEWMLQRMYGIEKYFVKT